MGGLCGPPYASESTAAGRRGEEAMSSEEIVIKGARQHNLKGFDLVLPRDKLIVITGISGSGKSSLAFDTIYAEGQRRYVESLSAYARQFLEQMGKPEVESIEGLSPAISIEQKTTSKNPRSTVGTVTEIYDYLRLLYARVGRPHCYKCGKPIESQTIEQIVDRVMDLPEGSKVSVLAPIVRGRKGEYREALKRLGAEGFVRVRVDGQVRDLEEDIKLDKKKKHDIDVFVDRLAVRPGKVEKRLADSLETALAMGDGLATVAVEGGGERTYSERHACVDCGVSYPEISPRMFSFNSPHGACPECGGLGTRMSFEEHTVIPDPTLSIDRGAVAPWSGAGGMSDYRAQTLATLAEHFKFKLATPWEKLTKKAREAVLYGSGGREIDFHFSKKGRSHYVRRPWAGVIPELERGWRETTSEMIRGELEKYMTVSECPACGGARLRPESLSVLVGERNIREVTALGVGDAAAWIDSLELGKREAEIAGRIFREISERLGFLSDVGLNYLTLDRSAATLSGGEGQRIRLATQIGSSLVGVLYILDEPSIGLHQRDNARLVATLTRLRDMGNTVIVVEHDEETIRSADHVVDMGPGAGVRGGEVVAQGTPGDVAKKNGSLTGEYLSGKKKIPVPSARREGRPGIVIEGARGHNLKEIDVEFPLGNFICVTGVSGSGKSTLVLDTLYRLVHEALHRHRLPPGPYRKIRGLEKIDKAIDIDQSPIGRTPRSNPATYTGVFGHIRDLFAGLPEARIRGYKPGRFSFNVKGGRCEACKGDGLIKVEMHFLPDIYVECDICKGRRYNRETLEIAYRGKTVADILEMTVNQAHAFLERHPKIAQILQTVRDVGLGYIKLGQSAVTLSGGEAQRIKLSRELAKRSTGRTLYLLDEPTTGLHFADVEKLLAVLTRLVDEGNTVVVIEHTLDVIKTADHVIDLGPEGGRGGGRVLVAGTPRDVTRCNTSHTGRFLKPLL